MRFRRQGCKIRSLPEKPPNRPAAHNENERQQSARSAAKKMLLLARLEEKKTKRKSKTKNKTKTTREKKLSGAQQFLTTRRCLGKTGVGEKKGKASRFPNSPQNKGVAGRRADGWVGKGVALLFPTLSLADESGEIDQVHGPHFHSTPAEFHSNFREHRTRRLRTSANAQIQMQRESDAGSGRKIKKERKFCCCFPFSADIAAASVLLPLAFVTFG